MTAADVFSLLKRFWFVIPIAGLLIALMLTRGTLDREKKAHGVTKANYAQFVADVKARTAQAQAEDAAHAARVERDQSTVTQEVSDDYQKQLAALRARYDALRVRKPAQANSSGSGSSPVSSVPDSTRSADDTAAEDRLPPADALIASEQALQLQALQEWVGGQIAVER